MKGLVYYKAVRHRLAKRRRETRLAAMEAERILRGAGSEEDMCTCGHHRRSHHPAHESFCLRVNCNCPFFNLARYCGMAETFGVF